MTEQYTMRRKEETLPSTQEYGLRANSDRDYTEAVQRRLIKAYEGERRRVELMRDSGGD